MKRADTGESSFKYESHSVLDKVSGCDEISNSDSRSDSTKYDASDCRAYSKKTGSFSGDANQVSKGNLWNDLEKKGLHAYVKEGKSWCWIAEKLGRTKAAVQVRWSLIKR